MFGLVVLAALALCAVVFIGVLGLVGWLVLLPFRILGWSLKLLGLLLALPFLLLGLALGGDGLLVAFGVLALPLLPLAAFVALIVWLLRGRGRGDDRGSHATIVS